MRVGLAALLSACSSSPEPTPDADAHATRGSLLWGPSADKSVARCGSGDYVRGVDVSKWQGAIDWSQVADAGIEYAFIRSSYGLTGVDTYFDANWAAAREAGVLRGSYHYFNPAYGGAEQARNMLAQFDDPADLGELPLVVDVEESGGAPTPAVYASRVVDFVDTIEAETGRRPMIYTGGYFWDTYVASTALADLPVWVAHYFNDRSTAHCPNTPNAWGAWAFWQHTEMASVSGISGGVDGDVFDGSYEALLALTFHRAERVSQSFPAADEAPLVLAEGECRELTLTVRNTGGVAWDPGVQLGLSAPRDEALAALASPRWPSATRLSAVDGLVALGEEHAFRFEVCGNTPGVHEVNLNLVHDGVAWFSDPGQGGPADDALHFQVEVVAADDVADAGVPPSDAGMPEDVDAGVPPRTSDGGLLTSPAPSGVRSDMDCSVARPRGQGGAPVTALLSVLAACAAVRRRSVR
jgi:lysozyme